MGFFDQDGRIAGEGVCGGWLLFAIVGRGFFRQDFRIFKINRRRGSVLGLGFACDCFYRVNRRIGRSLSPLISLCKFGNPV